MSELHDLELDPVETPGGSSPPEDPHGDRDRSWLWIGGLAVVVLLAALGWWFLRDRGEVPEPAAVAGEAAESAPLPPPASPVEEPEPEAIELPSLDGSDALVRVLVAGVSSHPALARWLVSDRLVRRFVVSVDNLADGLTPRKHVDFLSPRGSFVTTSIGGVEVPAESSYRRYDTLTQAFVSLDSEGTAVLYGQLKPLIAEAYRDLGYPSRDFDATLSRAIDHLLATPVLQNRVPLTAKVTSFEYADPALEELSEAQKQLLRMGPDNVARLQRKLRQLATALELPIRG